MRIGLDLDNTLICYDALFYRVARESGLIPESVAVSKGAVKSSVLSLHGNEAWTKLQAEVYGPRLFGATAYPGALKFVLKRKAAGHVFCILSHKTQFDASGGGYDLRKAALHWLEANRWIGAIDREDVEFHDTRGNKVQAIARRKCDVFVDDLPEVFAEPGFPKATRRVLFDPDGTQESAPGGFLARSWEEVETLLFAPDSR